MPREHRRRYYEWLRQADAGSTARDPSYADLAQPSVLIDDARDLMPPYSYPVAFTTWIRAPRVGEYSRLIVRATEGGFWVNYLMIEQPTSGLYVEGTWPAGTFAALTSPTTLTFNTVFNDSGRTVGAIAQIGTSTQPPAAGAWKYRGGVNFADPAATLGRHIFVPPGREMAVTHPTVNNQMDGSIGIVCIPRP